MTSIKTPDGTALACRVGTDDVIHISKLGLRPFGLDICSDENSLNATGNSLTKNTLKNTKAVIGIGYRMTICWQGRANRRLPRSSMLQVPVMDHRLSEASKSKEISRIFALNDARNMGIAGIMECPGYSRR